MDKFEQLKYRFYRRRFSTMKEPVDLLNFINYNVLQEVYPESTFQFKLKTLTYYAHPKWSKNRYAQFEISKKSGGKRQINAPQKSLKHLLRCVNYILQILSEPHQAATGFVPGKSIVHNAQKHINKNYVYNIDLKDFFNSFDRNRVKLAFMREPFNLKGEKESMAFFLACLVTHPMEIDGKHKIVLPQGSPVSPTLTNIICKTLDRRLNGLARRFNITYTRYADDITFSSDHNAYNNEEFQAELLRIITDQGFEINQDKVRLQHRDYRQEVTGLIVNQKVNVTSRYIKKLRMWLYYAEKYGYYRAEEIFKRDYLLDKGHVKKGEPSMYNVLTGKLEYLKMVKGPSNATYLKLRKRLDGIRPTLDDIDQLLNTWENEGIDAAARIYIKQLEEQEA